MERECNFVSLGRTVALSPCKDCVRRAVRCHSACVDYQAYKKKLNENRHNLAERKNIEGQHAGYCRERKEKTERKYGK